MNNKKITLTVDGIELNFTVSLLAYNSYLNEMTLTNKLAPAKQFLNRSVDKEFKENLDTVFDLYPGAVLQIAGILLEKFSPAVEIEVKN